MPKGKFSKYIGLEKRVINLPLLFFIVRWIAFTATSISVIKSETVDN